MADKWELVFKGNRGDMVTHTFRWRWTAMLYRISYCTDRWYIRRKA